MVASDHPARADPVLDPTDLSHTSKFDTYWLFVIPRLLFRTFYWTVDLVANRY